MMPFDLYLIEMQMEAIMARYVRIEILRHIQDRDVRQEHGLMRARPRYMARSLLRKREHHHVHPTSTCNQKLVKYNLPWDLF